MDTRDLSKKTWNSKSNTYEAINAGSLQRIADAAEKMASNYQKMETDLAMYKRWYSEKLERIDHLNRSMTAYRGVITKLKKKFNPK